MLFQKNKFKFNKFFLKVRRIIVSLLYNLGFDLMSLSGDFLLDELALERLRGNSELDDDMELIYAASFIFALNFVLPVPLN